MPPLDMESTWCCERAIVTVLFSFLGGLVGLDLEDVERILGDTGGARAELYPRIQQLMALEGFGPDQLDRMSANMHALGDTATLDEVFSNPMLLERVRDLLTVLDNERAQGQATDDPDQAGPSGEASRDGS